MHAGCFPRASSRRSCQRGSGRSNCITLSEEKGSIPSPPRGEKGVVPRARGGGGGGGGGGARAARPPRGPPPRRGDRVGGGGGGPRRPPLLPREGNAAEPRHVAADD